MKKYIVYITHYSGTKLPPWYIGSSYEEKVLNGYNGSVSSKKYKDIYMKEQKENKHLFKTRILSYHNTNKEALKEELRLQKLHKVVPNNKYFNESYAQPNGYFGRDISGKLHPMFGKTQSEESILMAVEKRKGFRHSEETKKKIGIASKNRKRSKESSLKISESNKGEKHRCFKGYYVYKGKRYASSGDMAKDINLRKKQIIDYCKNNNRIINNQMFGASNFFKSNYEKEEIIGLTLKEIGFDFIEV